MRNTYDNKNPYNKPTNQQGKQRQTYTAVNPKLGSFQKQAPSKNADKENIQKMSKNILDTLKRLSINNQTKVIGLSSLKPTQKTLMAVLSVLLNSFDNMFDQNTLTIEMLPQLFKQLGYPNQINKTYFQPIGAPHTWWQCLTMMDWLAQLAIFHIEIRSHLQQGEFDQDFTSMLIRAYLQNNLQIPRTHLQQSISKKGQIIQDSKYHTNTHTLQIDNIKASQKQINVMQDEKKRLQSILSRQTQQVIQVSQQNYQMQRRLRQLQAKIQQQKKLSQIHDDQIISLTKQIQSQQISVEQVQRIRFQIRQYHQKITQLKRFYQLQKENLDKVDNNIIDQYIQFNKTLQIVRLMYKKYSPQIERRNIIMTIPQCQIGSFTQFVKSRKQDWSQIRAQQLLGIKQIKQIKQKAQLLISKITVQLKGLQQTRQQLHLQNRLLNEQCLQRSFKANQFQAQLQQSKKKLQTIKNKISQTQLINFQLTSQMNKIQQQIRQALTEQQQLIKQTDELAREGMELGHLKLSLENEVNQSITRMEDRYKDYQFQFLQLLENDCEYFQQSVQQEYSEIQGQGCFQNGGEKEDQYMGNRQVMGYGCDGRREKAEVSRMNENSSSNYGRVFDSPPSQRVNRLREYGFNNSRK